MNKAIILIAHFKVKIKIKLADDSFKLPKKKRKKRKKPLNFGIPRAWDELYCGSRKFYFFFQPHEYKPNLYLL